MEREAAEDVDDTPFSATRMHDFDPNPFLCDFEANGFRAGSKRLLGHLSLISSAVTSQIVQCSICNSATSTTDL